MANKKQQFDEGAQPIVLTRQRENAIFRMERVLSALNEAETALNEFAMTEIKAGQKYKDKLRVAEV